MRIGQGFDAHRFQAGGRLVLGGVEIEDPRSLAAHSDGDVVLHALCDALLGAAGLRDIGRHFPDTDAAYRGADSRDLLRRVLVMIRSQGLRVGNVDLTVVAQSPRLGPYIPGMEANIATDCALPLDRVNVKATTTEHMGFTGREEGIAAFAVVLLNEPGDPA